MNQVAKLSWKIANETYKAVFRSPDPRVNGWFLMGTMYPVFLLVVLYLTFVKLAPKFMKQ